MQIVATIDIYGTFSVCLSDSNYSERIKFQALLTNADKMTCNICARIYALLMKAKNSNVNVIHKSTVSYLLYW